MSPICTAGKFITNIADSAVVLDHQNHWVTIKDNTVQRCAVRLQKKFLIKVAISLKTHLVHWLINWSVYTPNTRPLAVPP